MSVQMKETVLIVDDKPTNLILLEHSIAGDDLNIVKANTGEEAVGLARDLDLALVLLDVQMPGMDGFETAAALRSLPNCKYVPIIFVTAMSTQEKHVFKGYNAGAVDYMFKPVVPEVIRSKVRVFIELHRQKKLLDEQRAELSAKVEALAKANRELASALEHIKVLRGILPICVHCKKVRDDKGYWEQVERYLEAHSELGFTHGICPDCLRKHFPEYADDILKESGNRN